MTGEASPLLVNLADRGLVRILDLVFVRKEIDESVVAPELKDLNGEGELDLSVFESIVRTARRRRHPGSR